jgi:long-chain fatty acid transport protein
LVVDWPDNWQGRFDSINVKIRVTIINPTVALRATKNLSVAAGLRYANVAAELQQKFNFGNGESTGRLFDATANPIGWNVGLLYHVTETTSVGLQFRSEIQAKLSGKAEFSGPAAALFANTDVHSGLKLPPQLVVGISTKVIPRWTINADVEWEGWSTVGSIPIILAPTPQSPLNQQLLNHAGCTNQQLLAQNGCRLWRNSFVYRLGMEYAATDRLALRGGYFYDETPIPDNTFETNIPSANLHAVTAGLGYKWEAATVDLAYLIGFYEKRSIDNSTLDPLNSIGPTAFGSYNTTVHVLTASVTFKF